MSKWFGYGIPPSIDQENFFHFAHSKFQPKNISDSLCGKWLVFVPIPDMDKFWEKIAGHTIVGNLGLSSKIATLMPTKFFNGETTVVCVHTHNYRDKLDVMRVRKMLFSLKVAQMIYYKTDKATLANQSDSKSWTYRSSGEYLIEKNY